MWHSSPASPQFLQDLIDPRLLVVSSDTPLSDAIGLMQRVKPLSNCNGTTTVPPGSLTDGTTKNCVLVMQAGRLVGILTPKDVVAYSVDTADTGLAQVKVLDVMTHPVISLTFHQLQQHSQTLLVFLNQLQVSHLPVFEDGESLLGVLHRVTWQTALNQPDFSMAQSLQGVASEISGRRSSKRLPRATLRTSKRSHAAQRSPQFVDAGCPKDDHTALIHQTLREVTQRIRRVSTLEEILNSAVHEILNLLQADRVNIYRFSCQEQQRTPVCGLIEIEALVPDCPSMLGFKTHDPLLVDEPYIQHYWQGEILAIADIQAAGLDSSVLDLLNFFAIKSELVIPLLQGTTLWGLLVVYQCTSIRQWQAWEIDLLKQLVEQLMGMIQQAELYQQVHQLNVGLEEQVRERTAQLQQALQLEATLKRITDKVRDSLDEQQILQTVVRELVQVLGMHRCTAVLYDLQQRTGRVCYEHTQSADSIQGTVEQITDFPIFYEQLYQGQCFQFCEIFPYLNRGEEAILACPVFDNQQILGDLRLYTQRGKGFNELEVRLVQQVANQCAIAIRQARLYQAVQAQVRELEHLNQLKDDFLSTISHELRTPLSSIKMALQVLEFALKQEEQNDLRAPTFSQSTHPESSDQAASLQATPTRKVEKYLKILRDECDREIKLINNVLTLQQLDAGSQIYLPTLIRLQDWLPQILEVFEEPACHHQLTLQLDLPPELPTLCSDLFMLDNLLEELLTNACKFTPPGEVITLSAKVVAVQSAPNSSLQSGSDEPVPTKSAATVPPPAVTTQHFASLYPLRSSLDQISKSFVWIRVTNTGVTLRKEECDRVFDKFYRIPSSDPWKQGGTGLGLALVKKLTERLNGCIWVESEDNWTCFTVALPIDCPFNP
ncbi:MAG: GAF domain-containing protein [Scytolyngbya sp. HA4215-MV1]|jgi:signal transduction histidine kinase/CBS domain-containing protein|nr:GAF domain-containing protein [Scytolyngbya sp. HA4215-MV1]